MSRHLKLSKTSLDFCRCTIFRNVGFSYPGMNSVACINNLSTDSTNDAIVNDSDSLSTDDYIESQRNVSRLPKHIYIKMEHVLQSQDPHPSYERNRVWMQREYARRGKASGVDPGVMWPTVEELKEQKEFELEATLQERLESIKLKNENIEKQKMEKEAHVTKQLGKMPEYIKSYKQSIAKREEADRASESRKQALLEEARDYYGFYIHPNDPRFDELKEKKAEEELALKKARKKEMRKQKIEHYIHSDV